MLLMLSSKVKELHLIVVCSFKVISLLNKLSGSVKSGQTLVDYHGELGSYRTSYTFFFTYQIGSSLEDTCNKEIFLLEDYSYLDVSNFNVIVRF